MVQFTKQEVEHLKKKVSKDPAIIKWLQQHNVDILTHDLIVPQTGIATWSHYYYCPEHSVQLKFNYLQPKKHVCPIDGTVFTGEPYDGAWWVHINNLNATACFELSVLWLLTDEERYLNKVKEIMLAYATYYPSYEEHGGIPYNGPGKANSQTLTESNWIRRIASGYDVIREEFTKQEQEFIEQNLFTVCGEFLVAHRTPQIHNHEVVINGAIGILGILLDRKDFIDIAVDRDYGLMYQLDKAVLEDDLWFECAIGYHYFALESFFAYEKFARHTSYSRLSNPRYLKMLKVPFKFLQPDLNPPCINDMKAGTKIHSDSIYEFAYSHYKDSDLLWVLEDQYKDKSRNNLEAFLYGVDKLPKANAIVLKNYHNASGSGLTILHGENEKFLLIKHSPYAGEHDHYDRLGISFLAYGEPISEDLGTTGYGAILHYDYYKNTGTHNTICINEENQPPADTKVLRYEKNDKYTLLDAEVKWDGSFIPLDSHTRVEWDDESYKDVSMRRIIIWYDDYFIEVFKVQGVQNKSIDWVLHIGGDLKNNISQMTPVENFSQKKPFKYLKNVSSIKNQGTVKSTWELNQCDFNLYSFSSNDGEVYYGQGPNNPSTNDISYIVNRVVGESNIFVNVFEAHKKNKPVLKDIEIRDDEDKVTINITKEDGTKEKINIDLGQ